MQPAATRPQWISRSSGVIDVTVPRRRETADEVAQTGAPAACPVSAATRALQTGRRAAWCDNPRRPPPAQALQNRPRLDTMSPDGCKVVRRSYNPAGLSGAAGDLPGGRLAPQPYAQTGVV